MKLKVLLVATFTVLASYQTAFATVISPTANDVPFDGSVSATCKYMQDSAQSGSLVLNDSDNIIQAIDRALLADIYVVCNNVNGFTITTTADNGRFVINSSSGRGIPYRFALGPSCVYDTAGTPCPASVQPASGVMVELKTAGATGTKLTQSYSFGSFPYNKIGSFYSFDYDSTEFAGLYQATIRMSLAPN